MAPKGRLRLWIFCATAFVGCVALWNSKLITSAPADGLHQNVKRNSKRAVDEGDSVPWKREVHSGFSSIPYNDGDNVNTQPSAKCPVAAPSMLPCSCRSLARGIVVECTSPETRNALSDALSGLRDYVMSEAKLTGLTIEVGIQYILFVKSRAPLKPVNIPPNGSCCCPRPGCSLVRLVEVMSLRKNSRFFSARQ